jgi:hypothetical protein
MEAYATAIDSGFNVRIMANGGIIKLESEVGKGTTVVIGLPVMESMQHMVGIAPPQQTSTQQTSN